MGEDAVRTAAVEALGDSGRNVGRGLWWNDEGSAEEFLKCREVKARINFCPSAVAEICGEVGVTFALDHTFLLHTHLSIQASSLTCPCYSQSYARSQVDAAQIQAIQWSIPTQ